MRINIDFHFFSRRVFGAWVTGRIKSIGKKWIVISAYFNGVTWKEKVALDTEFYYASPHRLALNAETQAFTLATFEAK